VPRKGPDKKTLELDRKINAILAHQPERLSLNELAADLNRKGILPARATEWNGHNLKTYLERQARRLRQPAREDQTPPRPEPQETREDISPTVIDLEPQREAEPELQDRATPESEFNHELRAEITRRVEERMREELEAMLEWWRGRKDTGPVDFPVDRRPHFDRANTEIRTVRLNKSMFRDAMRESERLQPLT